MKRRGRKKSSKEPSKKAKYNKCPNPSCNFKVSVDGNAGRKKLSSMMKQHFKDNFSTCATYQFQCSCGKVFFSMRSYNTHYGKSPGDILSHKLVLGGEATDHDRIISPAGPSTVSQHLSSIIPTASAGRSTFPPPSHATTQLTRTGMVVPTNTKELRGIKQHVHSMTQKFINDDTITKRYTSRSDVQKIRSFNHNTPSSSIHFLAHHSNSSEDDDDDEIVNSSSSIADSKPSRKQYCTFITQKSIESSVTHRSNGPVRNYSQLLNKKSNNLSKHHENHSLNKFPNSAASSRTRQSASLKNSPNDLSPSCHATSRPYNLHLGSSTKNTTDSYETSSDPQPSSFTDSSKKFVETFFQNHTAQCEEETDHLYNDLENTFGEEYDPLEQDTIPLHWGDQGIVRSSTENNTEIRSDVSMSSKASDQESSQENRSRHLDQNNSDIQNDSRINTVPIINEQRPLPPEETSKRVDMEIMSYVKEIRQHRQTVSITPTEHLRYLKLFTTLSQSGTPASVIDDLLKSVHDNFLPKKFSYMTIDEECRTSTNDEMTGTDSFEAPSRNVLLSWISKIVHPPTLIEKAKPMKNTIELPSGRLVSLTTFDFKYQLALLLSNDHLMKKENLLFPNLDDPFEIPSIDCRLGDINTGNYHRHATASECTYRNELLFPGVCFNDGTNVTRRSIEPFMYCPGIFKRHIRNLPEAWMILGYLEPEANFSSTLDAGRKYTTQDKYNDYHAMLDHIFQGYLSLQKYGFSFDLYLNPETPFKVVFKMTIQLILGDCKGANVLCGRLGGHHGVLRLCRDCDVLTSDADKHNHVCKFHLAEEMFSLSSEQLKDLSFWKVENFFRQINFGHNEKFGIFGATPPELLHLFYLGLCVYLTDGFIDKLSGAMKRYLDQTAINIVIHGTHQSMREFPILSAYRNGFVTNVSMTTGKEKFSKVFMLFIFLLKQDVCYALNQNKKIGLESNPFSERELKKWLALVERTLALNQWMKAKSLDKKKLSQIHNDGQQYKMGGSNFMTEIRQYMHLYKNVVRREKGSQMCITRFHQLLHLEKYTLDHGVPSNFDGSRPEAIGKYLIKDNGKKTQKRMSTLTYQTGLHMYHSRNIQMFLTFLFTHHNKIYYQLGLSCRLEHDLLKDDLLGIVVDGSRNMNNVTHDYNGISPPLESTNSVDVLCDDDESSLLSSVPPSNDDRCDEYNRTNDEAMFHSDNEEEEPVNRGHNENETVSPTVVSTETRNSKKNIRKLGGSRFKLSLHNETRVSRNMSLYVPHGGNQDLSQSSGDVFVQHESGMKLEWMSKTKNYPLTWDDKLMNGIENRLFRYNIVSAGVINKKSSVIGYTELTMTDGTLYRAHPSYRSSLPWHDWAVIRWKDDDSDTGYQYIPARIMMIIDITDSEFQTPKYPEGVQIPHDKGIFHLTNEPYIVVQSALSEKYNPRGDKFRLQARLADRLRMEMKYTIIPASSIVGPAYVIRDTPYQREGDIGLWEYAISIAHPSHWRIRLFKDESEETDDE